MTVRRLAEIQPESFAYTPENEAWIEAVIRKYPEGRQASAVISALWRAQKQNDYWLPKPAIEKVAERLGMPYIRVLEIATFYSMFNLAPVGKYFIQLCGTTPCQLAGSDAIKAVLKARIGEPGRVTADGLFSWSEVECLGACCNAPMVQINDDYFEDLTPENFAGLLDDFAAGKPVRVGSQTGRISSEPEGGLTTLTSFYGADGHSGPFCAAPAAESASAAGGEDATRREVAANPALARLGQEDSLSAAKPIRTVGTGTKHTGVAVSSDGKQADAKAQDHAAKAGGAHQGGPSTPPGVERAPDSKPSRG
jgi:NADH-quinone oxidoreductase subunit E